MAEMASQSAEGFLPALVKGYLLGTALSAVVLHVAIGLIAPGDGGTSLALGSGAILFVLLIAVGLIGLVAFPIAALASWPLRSWTLERPLLALMIAIGVGVGAGGALTATEFQIGPGDFWSGPLVGLVYSVVWFWIVRTSVISKSEQEALTRG